MKLVIDRSKWLRGEGSEASGLLRSSDGKMCCLGQLALSIGATPEQITHVDEPEHCPTLPWPKGMLLPVDLFDEDEYEENVGPEERFTTSQITYHLMITNDAEGLSDAERENQLREEFAKLDIEVEFVN